MEATMILEMRTYTLHPGKMAEYWQHYADGGFAAQDPRMADHLVGYFQSDVGTLNQVVHVWRYDDVAQRAEIRAANYARSDWDAHLAKIRPLMAKQEAALLVPSPVSGMCPLAEWKME
ncbi:MAG: hypothetical protein ACI8S3_001178 [Alphaproteobacteria bacterium]|jgi:hypothetical protein